MCHHSAPMTPSGNVGPEKLLILNTDTSNHEAFSQTQTDQQHTHIVIPGSQK